MSVFSARILKFLWRTYLCSTDPGIDSIWI